MSTSPITDIAIAAEAMRSGGVIAYPTEGVYGLGCDPHDHAAFTHLFALKQRPPTQGVLLLGADFEQVAPYIDLAAVSAEVLEKVHASWPGPHTWIFPRSARRCAKAGQGRTPGSCRPRPTRRAGSPATTTASPCA
jgi:L-threonylcarbamoyladenylate synthase